MAFAVLRSAARTRFAWLLALAFWLPVAQWSAATHALLHLQAGSSRQAAAEQDRQQPAQQSGPCDLCVVAAAIGGAAPLPTAAVTPVLQAAGEAAADRPLPPLAAHPVLAYRSRAPPSLHA
jgi:hypothetical protein